VARDRAGKTALGQVLGKIFGGSREMLLANLVKERGIDAAELKRLRQILDERLGNEDK
jgi:predicted transcriptional regulator